MNRRMPTRGGLRRYADGGMVGVNKRDTMMPAPQSQKVPVDDPRGTPMSKQWFENYGAGPEHLFLGDRAIPPVGPFAQQSGLPPAPNTNPKGGLADYLPLVGMGAVVGKDLYDWYKNKKGSANLDPNFAKSVESGAMDTTQVNDWIQKDMSTLGERMPMPFMHEDGTVSYVGGDNDFWKKMDSGARNTSGTDAWVEGELNDYGERMPLPSLQLDPSLMDRLGQGAGGAFDLYMGSQQGGIGGAANMLSGAGDLYGSFAGPNAYSGMLGKTGGALGGIGNLYSGLQEGGVGGYTRAASGALQTANTLGLNTGALGSALGKGIPLVGGALGAYGAYNAAKVGDKKGAATQGAMAGASIGSVIPGIGTAVGAVIGGTIGLIGAAFGDKEQPSEAAYGAHKKLDTAASVRNWTPDQVGGAVFESIKSHTKSGNINKFGDVSEMYTAMGITKDAQKNYKNVQDRMGNFIDGVIQTAIQTGGLPSDPAQLRQLDGQQIYYKVVVPALAAKFKESTGQDSKNWTVDKINPDSGSQMQNMLADWTDYTIANWKNKEPAAPARAGNDLAGAVRSAYGKMAFKAKGGLATLNGGGMVPRRGGLSMAMTPSAPADSSTYYRYGVAPQQRPAAPPARQLPPMMQRAMGGLTTYGFNSGGAQRLVKGPGTGRSDDIPARLSDGEYVFDAETVALLGDGSTDEGARRLDALRQKLRMHKGKQLAKGRFSSSAKNPEEYL